MEASSYETLSRRGPWPFTTHRTLRQRGVPDQELTWQSRHARKGLESGARLTRASGVELIENLLPPERRKAVLALTLREPDSERLRSSGCPRFDRKLAYRSVLEELVDDESSSVRAFALYHAAEIGIDVRPSAEGAPAGSPLDRLRERALDLIENLPDGPAEPVHV